MYNMTLVRSLLRSSSRVTSFSRLFNTSNYPTQVKIVEVGPRDGLQNERKQVASRDKIQLVNMLTESGLSVIEVASFVNQKLVPQMSDAGAVFSGINKKPNVSYPVLVMNDKGLERAIKFECKDVAVFASASDPFAQSNVNKSADESLEITKNLIKQALDSKMNVRGYISCVIGCPYSGKIDARIVARIAGELLAAGCFEISLGDTIGVGAPASVRRLLDAVTTEVPVDKIAVHFHDTYGQALANILTALDMEVSVIDSSVSGLGGCPFAQGATGNVATEDVVYMLNDLGVKTGVDLDNLMEASQFIDITLQRQTSSRVAKALREKSRFERTRIPKDQREGKLPIDDKRNEQMVIERIKE